MIWASVVINAQWQKESVGVDVLIWWIEIDYREISHSQINLKKVYNIMDNETINLIVMGYPTQRLN